MRVFFLIKSTKEVDAEDGSPLYWCNKDGWVDKESATHFTSDEAHSTNLPLEAVWTYIVKKVEHKFEDNKNNEQ